MVKHNLSRSLVYFILFSILLSCTGSNDFKEIRDFKNTEWFLKDKQTFEFEITDVNKTYNFNYLLRNSVSYPFYNLYLQQELKDSEGKVLSSSLDEIMLFDAKTGKPFGDGMGDIFDSRIQAPKNAKVKFTKPGKYKWVISHNMRPDPLDGILSIGVEVIKNIE